MKALGHPWQKCLVALGLVLGLSAWTAAADQAPNTPNTPQPNRTTPATGSNPATRAPTSPTTPPPAGTPAKTSESNEDRTPEVKTLRFTHADPEEVRQVLTQLRGPVLVVGNNGNTPRPVSFATAPVGAGEARMVLDARTNTLFVRGTDKEVESIEELVNLLDSEPGKTPESKNVRLIRLHHIKLDEGLQVLGGLDLRSAVIPLAKQNALLVTQPAAIKQVENVLQGLDVDTKAGDKAHAEEKPKTGESSSSKSSGS